MVWILWFGSIGVNGGVSFERAECFSVNLSALSPQQNTHFVCFVVKDGHLYELDGRKHAPINHGPSTPETLLQDAVR